MAATSKKINQPLLFSTAQRVEILKKPWKVFGFGWNLLHLWKSLSEQVHAWMKKNDKPDAVLVGYMGHFDVLLAHHVFKGVPIILDHLILQEIPQKIVALEDQRPSC